MTVEEYYGAVRAMGLRRTGVPTVFVHVQTDTMVNVQDPATLPGTQDRLEALEILREKLARLT